MFQELECRCWRALLPLPPFRCHVTRPHGCSTPRGLTLKIAGRGKTTAIKRSSDTQTAQQDTHVPTAITTW